ncbi:MAG: hypothetical protein IT464_01075 [Planctomycetes bacterium]|nr:hypothetical protein [Planctomycetota bacterium]
MEDMLTSCVFGVIKHLPAHRMLFPFLAQAQFDGRALNLEGASDASYQFWPRLRDTDESACEPDLLLDVRGAATPTICVEAKYRSGKSGEDDADAATEDVADERHSADQLARQWRALKQLKRPFALVYLTAHCACPVAEIRASLKAIQQTSAPIFWLSWRALVSVIARDPWLSEQPLVQDLLALLDRLEMRPFEGISRFHRRPMNWAFTVRKKSNAGAFVWRASNAAPDWSFRTRKG